MNRSTAASSFSVIRACRRHLLRDVTTALLVAGLLLQSVQAVAPEWWEVQGVVNAQRQADDYAAVNVGQLKNLAKKTATELDRSLPGGAGSTIDVLIATWAAAAPAGVTRDDYAAVTVGQLKRVAQPFYDRLGLAYPWGTGPANDFAVANVGQLKRVFAFAVPDTSTLGLTDTDGDGFSDVLEFTEGTNPYLASDKPAGGGDVPPGGGSGGDGGDGGAEAGWTPAQLALAEAAYAVGLQDRSVGLGTEIEYAGGEPDDPDGVTVEKTYRVHPAWDEEPIWVAGPYTQAANGSNNVPAAELANGATLVHDAVNGYSLPDWDDPATESGGLVASGGAGGHGVWLAGRGHRQGGVPAGAPSYRMGHRTRGFRGQPDQAGDQAHFLEDNDRSAGTIRRRATPGSGDIHHPRRPGHFHRDQRGAFPPCHKGGNLPHRAVASRLNSHRCRHKKRSSALLCHLRSESAGEFRAMPKGRQEHGESDHRDQDTRRLESSKN